MLFCTFTAREASMFRRGVVLELIPEAMGTYGRAIQGRVDKAILDSVAAFELAGLD